MSFGRVLLLAANDDSRIGAENTEEAPLPMSSVDGQRCMCPQSTAHTWCRSVSTNLIQHAPHTRACTGGVFAMRRNVKALSPADYLSFIFYIFSLSITNDIFYIFDS